MGVPYIDRDGNLHRAPGPGGGQFEPKVTSPPVAELTVPAGTEEGWLRAKFSALWSQLREEGEGGGLSNQARRDVLEVAVRRLTSEQAPVVVQVQRQHAGPAVSGAYRQVGEDLLRPVVHGGVGAGEPVTADEHWLAGTAEGHAQVLYERGMVARDATEVQAAVQEAMDGYAAVDGEVWHRTQPPVYVVPRSEEQPPAPSAGAASSGPVAGDDGLFAPAPCGGVGLTVVPAPTTTEHAALGYYPASRYAEAVADVEATAERLGVDPEPLPPTPPIVWLAELGLVNEGSWREGARLMVDPSSSLTVGSWAERFERFRQQIAEQLPDAVSGDVGAFQVVPRFRLDRRALTETQYAEYRRYVLFGLEHGLM